MYVIENRTSFSEHPAWPNFGLLTRSRGAVQTLGMWWIRARDRRNLLHIDDRLLSDINVTREYVLREASKPFWRD